MQDGTFKTGECLKRRMNKFHEVVLNAVSPMASTARILFSTQEAAETASVQGNSTIGQINFPSVFTEESYQCGNCEEQFSTREQVLKPMDEKHDKTMTAKAKPNDKPGKDD